MTARPRLVVFTTLFPSAALPDAGVFIRERMARVAGALPLVVVAPVPWFPLQGLLRRLRPHFRPALPARESVDGLEVLRPRFFSVPGMGKRLDGFFLALCSLPLLRRLQRAQRCDIIDSHFAYPEGYAASLLGRWLELPYTVTLRGTETRLARHAAFRKRMGRALRGAAAVFAVSESLRREALALGAPGSAVRVVGNGVDTAKFHAVDKLEARRRLVLPPDAPVLVTVGGLVERKGFHRVIDCLPALRAAFPELRYLIVGGPGPEGSMEAELRAQVARLGLDGHVVFTGALPSQDLKYPLSAADLFVLASRNEGRPNALLEAMACGLPVVATDVGGNAELVCAPELGSIVPFGDATALERAIAAALGRAWDRAGIAAHAGGHAWEPGIAELVAAFRDIARSGGTPPAAMPGAARRRAGTWR